MSTDIRLVFALSFLVACGPTAPGFVEPDGGEAPPPDAAPNPDAPPSMLPDARSGCISEVCDNGLDDDCDGTVDNGCFCMPGAQQACFTGPADSRGLGLCHDGVMVCTGTTEFGTWGPCEGEQTPVAEVCDAAMLDENCDGAGNEGCSCTDGTTSPCGTDVGECVAGTQDCVDGMLGPCVGSVGPGSETCNNLDDDCDGTTDEGLTTACGMSVGACMEGTSTCAGGLWGPCEGAVDPVTESCNGIDDDCDGVIDDGLSVVCGTDVGACVAGISMCTMGAYGPCTGSVGPAGETCNNLDDDCDGPVDESLTQPCGSDTGDCVAGTQTCAMGAWGPCAGSVGPTGEDCNGGDEDCDGMVDEGCVCTEGDTINCGSDVGACVHGTQTCTGGAYGPCTGGVGPVTEMCGNGLDDDCDGMTDEGCSNPVATCPGDITTTPLSTVSLSGSGFDPDGGTVTYLWTVTVRPPGSTSNPVPPNAATTSFFVDLAGLYTLTLTVTDDEGLTASCTVDINSVPSGDIHIELVWDTSYGDADLHMTCAGCSPSASWYMAPTVGENDCWYANTNAAWPPMGPSGNASLDIDDTDGYGPENINIATSPTAGTYEIGVAYYCSHSIGPGMIDPGDGSTDATVNIYCGGLLVDTIAFPLDETGRFVDVATLTWPGCAVTPHTTNTWTALVQPTYYTSPLHCTKPCSSPGDCGGGETCMGGTCRLD